jgi:hypothetical protein
MTKLTIDIINQDPKDSARSLYYSFLEFQSDALSTYLRKQGAKSSARIHVELFKNGLIQYVGKELEVPINKLNQILSEINKI